jgi:2-dehydro-3-deoxygluconokinase
LVSKDAFHVSKKYEIRDIVDRIGGGDSFASGLIWGMNNLNGLQEAAASALKHTIYGDFNRVVLEDVLPLIGSGALGRVQR